MLNSVIQYFPSVDYLLDVLGDALRVVRPNGKIFIGDVRDLQLLENFCAKVQLCHAEASQTKEALKASIQKQIVEEEELLVSPEFFFALKKRFTQISYVQVQLKRGHCCNELTQFRYDVVLHIGEVHQVTNENIQRVNWLQDQLTFADVKSLLEKDMPECLVITEVPNARLLNESKIVKEINSEEGSWQVYELKKLLNKENAGIDPETFWSLEKVLPYSIDIRSNTDKNDHYDVCLKRSDKRDMIFSDQNVAHSTRNKNGFEEFVNNPLQGKFTRRLMPQLRKYLEDKLPDYMIPSAYISVEHFPLTSNGKLDYQALPMSDKIRPEIGPKFVFPKGPVEIVLAEAWADILGLEEIGMHDNFFALGGHSLLATQFFSWLRELFRVELPLQSIFEFPTLHEFITALSKNLDRYTHIEKAAALIIELSQISDDETENVLLEKSN